ncbi:MAG: hypothetical protein ABGX04_08595 [Myxococcales bacterium]|nr:hypothetical protein [Myxococcales bacterium]
MPFAIRRKVETAAAVAALLLTAQAVIASEPLTKYSDNINLARLDTYMSVPKTEVGWMSRTALLSGYSILYDFVLEPGGNEKFISFTRDCYDKAWTSPKTVDTQEASIELSGGVTWVVNVLPPSLRKEPFAR